MKNFPNLVTLLTRLFQDRKCFRDDELNSLTSNLRRLSTLSQIQARVNEICDASFLFCYRAVVPIHFGYIFDNDKKEANRLPVSIARAFLLCLLSLILSVFCLMTGNRFRPSTMPKPKFETLHNYEPMPQTCKTNCLLFFNGPIPASFLFIYVFSS